MTLVSLSDELATLRPNPRTFDQWLALKPADADTVVGYLRDSTIAIDPLLKTLRKHGIPCTHSTVKAYRESDD